MEIVKVEGLLILTSFFVGFGIVGIILIISCSINYCEPQWIDPIPMFFVGSTPAIAIFVILIVYRRTLYADPSMFDFTASAEKQARKCTICGRHPLSQKHHARWVHRLKKVDFRHYFEDCGCELCHKVKLLPEEAGGFT